MSDKDNSEPEESHWEKYRYAYMAAGGIVFAGISWGIVRGVASSKPIGVGIVSDAAHGGIVSVMGKGAMMNNVSFISSNRQGSPSWVVRCLETDEVFTSQRKAALEMGISQRDLSQHLNGLRDYVGGHTFERICMAA